MKEYEDLAPNFKNALMKKMSTESPFWGLLGMELVDVKKGWASVKLPFTRQITQPLGIAHGGAIFSTADSAVAMALLGMVARGEVFTAVELKINYIKPFVGGEIAAEATILSKGSRIAVGEIDVRDSSGELVAKGVATYLIMKKRESGPSV